MIHALHPFFDPRTTPGQSSARVQITPNLEQGRRYQSQNVRKVVPGPSLGGTKWSDLPKTVLKGCPHCGGALDKEHPDFGYGDYSCVSCGRAWDVETVTAVSFTSRGGTRMCLKFGRVGHYLEQPLPKRHKKRAKYDYD